MTVPTVILVLGKGRSGSTLLDRMLGELPGVVSTGELWRVWERGAQGDLCGCGERIDACAFWRPVLDGAREGMSFEELELLRRRALGWARAPDLALAVKRGRPEGALAQWVHHQGKVYEGLAAQGAQVVADSSKWPLHPALFGLMPGIRPVGLHLLRDPRAVAFAWQKKKAYTGSATRQWMRRFPAWYTALSWSVRTEAVDQVERCGDAPVVSLRYEDLVAEPEAALRRVAREAGIAPGDLGFLHGRTARFGTHHTVGGNPDRFAEGEVQIRVDEAWRERIAAEDLRTVERLTARGRRRHGYA